MKIEIKKVQNGILRVTTTDERWYQIGETFLPSVTWICGHYPKGIAFYKWLADKGWDEAEAIKSAAGDKGSKVHKAIEDILKGKTVKYDSKYRNPSTEELEELTPQEYGCVMSFVDWAKETNPEVIATEYTVINQELGYAGTVDFKAKINGQVYLIDLKTSQQVWPEHELQVSAYKHADKGVEKLAILQVGYNRNKAKYKFTDIEDKFDLFLAARQIWVNETAGTVPLQKDYPLTLSWKKPVEKKPRTKKVAVRRKVQVA